MVSSMYDSEVAPVKSQQHWSPKQDVKTDISGHANEDGGRCTSTYFCTKTCRQLVAAERGRFSLL